MGNSICKTSGIYILNALMAFLMGYSRFLLFVWATELVTLKLYYNCKEKWHDRYGSTRMSFQERGTPFHERVKEIR